MGCGGSKPQPKAQPKAAPAAQKAPEKKAESPAPPKAATPIIVDGKQDVMGKFKMNMSKEDTMGEGTSSICRKGTNNATGQEVAIKVYKDQKGGGSVKTVTLQKFKRQIEVLNELQEPFKQPTDATLWHEQLASVKPSRIFMQLLDYSKDANGTPAQDQRDGVLYVITELAQYSLKDFLAQRREQKKPLAKDAVRNISKAVVVAMAGLHAKGFVHVDMKPENMMMFNGRLKVIDVDGCVRAGTRVSIQDSSISFSPCYCAPEWARFLISESEPTIVASPGLDVWSVGMTLCELVTLDAVLKPQYANFLRNAHSHREAGFLFMEWLSTLRKAPVPKSVDVFDRDLMVLICDWLLVCNAAQRKSCAQCLSNSYVMSGNYEKENDKKALPEESAVRIKRDRPEDDSTLAPIFKGSLWKLNSGADPKKNENWIKRDMWIGHNHALCYFSVKENKRLVLVDGTKITTSTVNKYQGMEGKFSFEVKTGDDKEADTFFFAAETQAECDEWVEKLSKTGRMDMIVTFQLGEKMAEELQAFRLTVKNRRIKVDPNAKDQFEPLFRAKLWKLKGDGDRTKADDWFERDMWIAKNGSLVYFSPKEERELVYYTAQDVGRGKIDQSIPGNDCKKFIFQILLPPVDGVEFSPGEFATDTEALKQQWITELQKFQS